MFARPYLCVFLSFNTLNTPLFCHVCIHLCDAVHESDLPLTALGAQKCVHRLGNSICDLRGFTACVLNM